MRKTLVWIAAVAAVVFTFDAASAQGGEDDPAQVEAGAAVFEANCASCHGAEGEGSAVGRRLTGVAAENDRARHVATVTDGRSTMPGFGAVLSAEEIDAVVSFVRLTFVAQDEGGEEPAEEEPAEESPEEEPELADTGVESAAALIAAVALLGAGGLFIRSSRPGLGRS
ncbi:MAG: cytochrome c [Actinomycetota bacterium]